MSIKIPKATDLAREVENLESAANQKILAKIVQSLENCKKQQARKFSYYGDLPAPVKKELKAAGYKLEYWSDFRDNDCGYNISF